MELGSVSDSMLGGLRFGHPASVRHPDSLGVLNPVPCLQIPASFPQVSGGISIHWHGLYMWEKAAWYEGGGLGRGEWWEMRGQGGSRVRVSPRGSKEASLLVPIHRPLTKTPDSPHQAHSDGPPTLYPHPSSPIPPFRADDTF